MRIQRIAVTKRVKFRYHPIPDWLTYKGWMQGFGLETTDYGKQIKDALNDLWDSPNYLDLYTKITLSACDPYGHTTSHPLGKVPIALRLDPVKFMTLVKAERMPYGD